MRTITWILSGILLAVSGYSQELIRNPAKPLNPDPGRVLKLEQVFEISDASGEFFFKYPYRFHLDDQKRLYISDDDQLLQFSPQGKFIRNFYKKGQGPGEIASNFQMVSFVCADNDLFVYDGMNKIIRFDGDGKFLGEIRQAAGRLYRLFGIGKMGFFMQGQENAPMGGPAGLKEIKAQAFIVSLDGSAGEKILDFSYRIYQGPSFGMVWDTYNQVFNPRDGSLYVSQTGEYKVVRADLLNRQIVTSFTRDYPRIKFTIPGYLQEVYKKRNPPVKDFEDDISEMFLNGDNLWVMTSTLDKDKGRLFDVFDPQGRFLDSFYLDNDMKLALADGYFIYVKTQDKDENIFIKKYKVLNGTKF